MHNCMGAGMKKNWVMFFGVVVCVGGLVGTDAFALAKKTTKQAAIQKGTSVRVATEAKGVYDQECFDIYYGCMDQFCMSENESGGRCMCSDAGAAFDKRYEEILVKLDEAERVSTVEVEKIKAGAQADIIFTGTREYDEDGNLVDVDALVDRASKKKERQSLLDSFFSDSYDEYDWDGMVGAELYEVAEELCYEQVPDKCADDIDLLHNMYSRQIVSDCKGYENSLATQESEGELALLNAQSDVRNALKESFEAANEYDRGMCMVEFKKCMQTDDACGKNWENCVSIIASENMQNNIAKSTAGTKVGNVKKYNITESTMEILESKRFICERVLNKCVAVRDMVWPDFLREAAPTLKVAESAIESKFRQSCLMNISNCIQNACRDDIAGKGIATIDACLARPDMVRSFCKVEIDPCERMEPQIWSYVQDKIKALRVDACTEEVRACFTADTRCGKDFQNCIGMDYSYIRDICPKDSLVVCKADNPEFSMDDLDSLLMGMYLNIDNAALEQCQNVVDRKMAEICGSTSDCNRFASDDTIGTGSLRSQKDGTVYRVTGMISFGSIKMGDALGAISDGSSSKVLAPGKIGVEDYLKHVKDKNRAVPNKDEIIASIEEELNNIAGTINRTIDMIEQDPEIQFCINGRDLSQITGKGGKTEARFPNLLTAVKMQIAVAALRQAQDNYNKKLNEEIAEASKDASLDVAQYMCQKMAQTSADQYGAAAVSDPLTAPYAISYDVGSGLKTTDLTKGGHGISEYKTNNGTGSGMHKETTAVFSRETRTCHLCTTITTTSCSIDGGNWFSSRDVDCSVQTSDPFCQEIKM